MFHETVHQQVRPGGKIKGEPVLLRVRASMFVMAPVGMGPGTAFRTDVGFPEGG